MIEESGFEIAGLQSLLFNRNDLQIFGDAHARSRCLAQLRRMVDLCSDLGGTVVAFGSASNRKLVGMQTEEAVKIAVPFFRALAEHAEARGVAFCFEPVSVEFGCEFVNNHAEAVELIRCVSHTFFRLLWDSGNASSAGEDFVESFRGVRSWVGHVHANDSPLKPPSRKNLQHRRFSEYLRETQWNRWVSLEFLSTRDVFSEVSDGLQMYGQPLLSTASG